MTLSNTFPGAERFKSRKKLQEVFTKGEAVRTPVVRLVYLAEESVTPELKCGVGLTTRHFKRAVDRNRIKRLLREAYRLQQHSLKTEVQKGSRNWLIFILYTGRELPHYTLLYQNVGLVLQKLITNVSLDTKNM